MNTDITFKSPVLYGQRNEFGFMLEGKPKAWKVGSKDLLPPSFVTGEASYDNIRPDEIGPLFIASDWRRGFGAKDFEEDKRYFSGTDTDARFKNRIMLSPLQGTAIALPTGPEVTDGGFETWTDVSTLTNWTKTLGAGATLTKVGGGYAGDFCALLFTTNTGADASIYQDVAWSDNYQSKTMRFSVYYKCTGATAAYKLKVEDGVDTTTETLATDTVAEWTLGTIHHTFNAAASQCRITIWLDTGTNNDCYFYVDAATMRFYTTALKGVDFGSATVVAVGPMLVKTTDGATFSWVTTFTADITDLKVFGDNLIIALGNSTAAFYTADLATFTELTTYAGGDVETVTTAVYDGDDVTIDVVATTGIVATDYVLWEDEVCQVDAVVDGNTFTLDRAELGTTASGHASGTTIRLLSSQGECEFLSVVGGSQLWASTADNTVRVTDNITTTPFSTAYTVGQDGFNITGLVDNPEGTVFVACQDQPYYLSGSDVLPVADDVAPHKSTSNDYPLYQWKGILFMPRGSNKLYAYDIDGYTLEDISPAQTSPTDGDYDGKILCMAFDSDYAYCACENGTKVQILAGRYEAIDSGTEWVWHTLYEETTNDYTCMWVSNVSGSSVLYAATATTADGIDNFALPSSYSDNLIEGLSFQTTGEHVEPYIVTQFSENDKLWSGVYVSSINFSGVTSIGVYYQLDTDSDWTLLGMCGADDYDWTATPKVWPTEKSTYFTIGKVSRKIRFKFALKGKLDSSTTTLTPIVTRYRVDGKVENSLDGTSLDKAMIQCQIRCAGVAATYGPMSMRTAEAEIEALWWLKRLGQPVILKGYDKIERTVKFRSLTHEAVGEPTTGKPIFTATCLLEEV